MKNNSPLLTKTESSLILAGLSILAFMYFSNSEKKAPSASIKSIDTFVNAETKAPQKNYRSLRAPTNLELDNPKEIKQDPKDLALSFKDDLKRAEACINSKSCELPITDPRSYNLAAYRGLSLAIEDHRTQIVNEWDSEIRSDFKRYLSYHDGYVKESALKTILKLTSKEASEFTDIVIKDVIFDHNTQLMEPTMDFIKKINNPQLASKFENAWVVAMITGSPNKSEALAKYSHHMINNNSLNNFKRALDKLPNQSAERAYLEASLKEYEMTQSGG
jgi:hypothetical protein